MHLHNVLVINVHSSQNAGDAALLEVAISQIHQIGSDNITVSLDDPDYYKGPGRPVGSLFAWIKQDGHWHLGRLLYLPLAALVAALSHRYLGHVLFFPMPQKWRETIEAYLRADAVFVKPGGFLYSSGRGLSLIISVYSMFLALIAGKPLYIFPQSIGPLRHHWERLLIRLIFDKARIGFVREPISRFELERCGLQPEKYPLIPDMAFAFPSASTEEAKEWLRESEHIDIGAQDRPLMGVTLIDWAGQNNNFKFQQRYEVACATAIRLFLERWGGRVFFFPQVCGPLKIQDDRIVMRRVMKLLPDSDHHCILIENQPPPRILKALYGFMDIFIATRLHSAIFAWSQGVPSVVISYQPKTMGVAQMLGLEDWVINIEDITPEYLFEILTSLWERRREISTYLQRMMPSLIQQVNFTRDLIIRDLEGLNVLKDKSG
ncbi:MAG: polysaccharide pyruvyl transferase family protein [Candidatus Hadarchaeum sp.]|uniref:polysaccharide pyruvyl transferase family protein n=1 Tax=Candidatus Hadarchaeum sp. TaxID=2883567 RepID=UPI00317BD1F8